MVSTPLKNISQLGWLFSIYGKKCSKPPTRYLLMISNYLLLISIDIWMLWRILTWWFPESWTIPSHPHVLVGSSLINYINHPFWGSPISGKSSHVSFRSQTKKCGSPGVTIKVSSLMGVPSMTVETCRNVQTTLKKSPKI